MMKINIKKLNSNAIIPKQGSVKSAGYDLYACLNDIAVIPPHNVAKIPTGLAIQPPLGYFGAIFARSGLAVKQGLTPANCVGLCDEDYTGEYIVALRNNSDEVQWIKPNDRIAQLVFLPYLLAEMDVVDELDETDRGDGGFGSTGK